MEKLTKIIGLCLLLSGDGICSVCKCNLEELIRQSVLKNSTLMGKRQLPDIDEDGVEGYGSPEVIETSMEESSSNQPMRHKVPALNETHFELNETEFQLNNEIKEVCPYYKHIPELEIYKMPDNWQLAYFKSPEANFSCFIMTIKRTTVMSRSDYRDQYSSFNGTIVWRECYLELVKTRNSSVNLKHFLQGQSRNDKAILENIVISETFENDTKTITLQEQAPDQWMIYKNLLLMRDCDIGTLLVFSRVPTRANYVDVENALKLFGEKSDVEMSMDSCEDEVDKSDPPYKHVRYNILS